jgi:hypothetical protein
MQLFKKEVIAFNEKFAKWTKKKTLRPCVNISDHHSLIKTTHEVKNLKFLAVILSRLNSH